MKARGFTLIELLITVAIVALLASVALPLAEVTVQRNKEKEFRQTLREIRLAIDAYKRAADEGAIEKAADASGYPPTLATLVEGVKDKRKTDDTKIYFLRRVPPDPFAAEPAAPAAATWGKRCYASPPDEPAEGPDVFDVYSRSATIGLDGRPYRQW
jgi:general secretion pathway protein G